MTTNIQDLIDEYSKFRGLVEPNELESLLFFFSEVGELAEAYLEQNRETLDENQRCLMIELHNLGLRADSEVSRMNPGWVRNYDRRKKPEIAPEIGDCRMMLEKFSRQFGFGGDSEFHLRQKMAAKGFVDVKVREISQDLFGLMSTKFVNLVKLSLEKTPDVTVRDVWSEFYQGGIVSSLSLGKVGSMDLIESLKKLGYYRSRIELEQAIPIARIK